MFTPPLENIILKLIQMRTYKSCHTLTVERYEGLYGDITEGLFVFNNIIKYEFRSTIGLRRIATVSKLKSTRVVKQSQRS